MDTLETTEVGLHVSTNKGTNEEMDTTEMTEVGLQVSTNKGTNEETDTTEMTEVGLQVSTNKGTNEETDTTEMTEVGLQVSTNKGTNEEMDTTEMTEVGLQVSTNKGTNAEMDTTEMTEVSLHLSTNKGTNKEKRIKHYSSFHRILLVGEGDFSFSACLARAFGSAINMVATSLDSKGGLMLKYPTAEVHLEKLLKLGCTVLHGVDAHTMSKHPVLSSMKFDRIVFNFPHSGLVYREHDHLQIRLHEKLVKGFFRSGREMLTSNGEIHVTHKTAHPFSLWRLEDLAGEVGLSLLEKANFRRWDYPYYQNKRGYASRGKTWNSTFPVGECCTFKFLLLKMDCIML